jgi:GTP-binding protein EngB required for normal cell division
MALFDRFERFLDQVIPPPEDVQNNVARGEALLGAGDVEGAASIADGALLVAPGFLRAIVLRADALAAFGRDAEALGVLESARKVRALPAEVLARMVELAARTGDEWRALDLEAHARARVLGANEAVARRLLAGARALIGQGSVAAGLRLARGATLVDPSLGAAWLVLGRDALARGDRALARRAIERGVAGIDPSDVESNRVAGEIAWALGDRATATRCLRRAWITGDEGAFASLVAVLASGDETAALERVLAHAHGTLARVARAVAELARAEAPREPLDGVTGREVPDVLWHYAIDVALRSASELAARWCREAPDRPGARSVLALADATERVRAGDLTAAREHVLPALGDPVTRVYARRLLREILGAAWRDNPGALLEGLAALVRAAPGESSALEDALRARRRELDEPLRVVLLGEFSAGKSTFLNALVGAEVSPMGVLPTTAHVHWLRQGERLARVYDRRGGVIETSVEEAARAVTRRRSAGFEIDHVEVTLPVARLGRMEILDTPGFNAGDESHEEAVRRAFELADVALWIFDARQAGKQSEVAPLEEARARGLPVVGVLNKIDQCPLEERDQVLASVRAGFGALAPCVAAVSARQALAARRSLDGPLGDGAAAAKTLRESGWEALSGYLDANLVERRAQWKRARVAWRARLLVSAAWSEVEGAVERAERRVEAWGALAEAVQSLREGVVTTGASVRREVEVALRDQLRGLRDERGREREALVTDAVAEIGYRARQRALESLAPRLRAVEAAGCEVGLASPEAAGILTAPVVQHLDHVVAEGVRDASVPLVTGAALGASGARVITFAVSDPMAALEAAIDQRVKTPHAPSDAWRIALEVAREELSRFDPPKIEHAV